MPANTIARVTAAGSSGAAEPVWGSVGSTISDGTVTYIMLPRTIDFASQAEVTAGKVDNKIVTPAMLGQTVQVDLASTKRVNLNEADKSVTPGVTGILPVAHGGTGQDHLPYTPNAKGSAWDGTHFPAIGSDGVAEVGSILDFHEKSADDADYSLRLASSGGKLMVNGTDIMSYINNVKSQAGVVAGNVANANSWWVKLGGTIPLIIQGGYVGWGTGSNGNITFPVAFTQNLTFATGQGAEGTSIPRTSSVSNTGAVLFNVGTDGGHYSGFAKWIATGL
ncbi:hypothetical protein [Dialister succinatiphilus]|uniref:hypothetical protein n=1 Tax=Dialister succinatiphilus TaxID=487173 RepID=UPI003F7CD5A3